MLLNSAPLITYYSSDASGIPNRVELSQVTVSNWIAKTSNLLAEEFGFGPELAGEASARIELPLHWLHSVWLASIWNVGAYVTTRTKQASILVTEAAGVGAALDLASRNQAVVGCTLGSGLDPLGPGSPDQERTISPTATDYSHEVRMFADSFDSGYTPNLADIAFESDDTQYTHGELAQLASGLLHQHGVALGGRVLLAALPTLDQASPVVALGALVSRLGGTPAPASLVLCDGLPQEQVQHIAEQERAQRIA